MDTGIAHTRRVALRAGARQGDKPPLTRADLDEMGLELVGQEPWLPEDFGDGVGSTIVLSGPMESLSSFLNREEWRALDLGPVS